MLSLIQILMLNLSLFNFMDGLSYYFMLVIIFKYDRWHAINFVNELASPSFEVFSLKMISLCFKYFALFYFLF